MVMTASAPAARFSGPSAALPPTSRVKSSTLVRSESRTASWYPAGTSRAAIGHPMFPRPTKPTERISSLSIIVLFVLDRVLLGQYYKEVNSEIDSIMIFSDVRFDPG